MLILIAADNDAVTFEECVCLVVGKPVLVGVVIHDHRRASNDLTPVTDGLVVRESEFAEMMQSEETGEELGNEEKVVV